MSALNGHAATVQVLTADVRTLQAGARQVTLSVYRQLGWGAGRAAVTARGDGP
jgi:hypothetical protein